ncbi:Nuclear valosin-containing protein-like [Dirofilaria immitis]|nr:Nuclear valosin-containing protein-like [Dirofilaria immitis]
MVISSSQLPDRISALKNKSYWSMNVSLSHVDSISVVCSTSVPMHYDASQKTISGFRSDPRLVPRIRDDHVSIKWYRMIIHLMMYEKTLQIWQVNKGYDAEDIACHLQQTYPEYARRKSRDFLKSVEIGLGKIKIDNMGDGVIDLTNESTNMSSSVERKRKLRTKTMKKLIPAHERNGNFNVPEADLKRPRKSYSSFGSLHRADINVEPSASHVTFSDLGGCEQQFLEVCRFVMHLLHPEINDLLGVTHPTGFLLHGPPGCGKTLFAQAVAGAIEESPCVLLLDDIDAIASKRDNAQREMEKRVVSQLIACLDDLSNPREEVELNANNANIDVSVEKVLQAEWKLWIQLCERAGRFDKEIALGIPDKRARAKILEIVCKNLRFDGSVILQELARLTPGYVGADLKTLSREAASCAVNRAINGILKTTDERKYGAQKSKKPMLIWLKSSQKLDKTNLIEIHVTMEDFNKALTLVDPSAKREGFATVPNITWNDIGALESIREELKWSILVPIQQPELFGEFGMESKPQGILLCGPPGCGKTLLAKAVANESGMNFISIKGPELLSMYVGESERAVRTVFQRARDSSPCTSGSSRLVNQLLTEMDGIESRKEVFLIGATNRPDIVDGAILRPGRLDKILFVDFPNAKEKEDILCKITHNGKRPHLSDDFCYKSIVADPALEWFTGADIAALVHEAGIIAMQESLSGSNIDGYHRVTMTHFKNAAQRIRPSIPEKDRIVYQKLKEIYGKVKSL